MPTPATAFPDPSAPKASCNTADMRIVHAMFRNEFERAAPLVSGVRAHDARRADLVGRHLATLSAQLHAHHEHEDAMLWDTLAQRAPACALHVSRMRAQHARMRDQLIALDAALDRWRPTGSPTQRDIVAAAVDDVRAALAEHLPDEEESILPTASASMSQREWDRIGARARKETPPNRLFIQLGMMLEPMTESEREAFLRHQLPAPVRLLYRVIGRRQYARYRARIDGPGTAHPERR